MRVAMISYNAFVDGERNGWKNQGDNAVLLLQNEDGSKWGVTQSGGPATALECTSKVDGLFGQLVAALPTLDKVVFYVGSYGAEHVIELAAANGLTPDKAIFVFCDCNMSKKQGVLRTCGFASSEVIMCSCGGHGTMQRLYNNVLTKGSLPN